MLHVVRHVTLSSSANVWELCTAISLMPPTLHLENYTTFPINSFLSHVFNGQESLSDVD
jgi:hypothetical protein